jgi:ATP-dependent RNA helicase DDX51/DBP6
MPAPLFKRFAPPTSATVRQPSSPSSFPAPVKADAELSTEAATPKREKKSKKSSKTAGAVADPVERQEDVVMDDAPTLETSKKTKKSKKGKTTMSRRSTKLFFRSSKRPQNWQRQERTTKRM